MCPNCGHLNEKGVEVCPECGYALTASPSASSNLTTPQEESLLSLLMSEEAQSVQEDPGTHWSQGEVALQKDEVVYEEVSGPDADYFLDPSLGIDTVIMPDESCEFDGEQDIGAPAIEIPLPPKPAEAPPVAPTPQPAAVASTPQPSTQPASQPAIPLPPKPAEAPPVAPTPPPATVAYTPQPTTPPLDSVWEEKGSKPTPPPRPNMGVSLPSSPVKQASQSLETSPSQRPVAPQEPSVTKSTPTSDYLDSKTNPVTTIPASQPSAQSPSLPPSTSQQPTQTLPTTPNPIQPTQTLPTTPNPIQPTQSSVMPPAIPQHIDGERGKKINKFNEQVQRQSDARERVEARIQSGDTSSIPSAKIGVPKRHTGLPWPWEQQDVWDTSKIRGELRVAMNHAIRGDFKHAGALLDSVGRHLGDDPEYLYHVGLLLMKLDRKEELKLMVENARHHFPPTPALEAALAAIS